MQKRFSACSFLHHLWLMLVALLSMYILVPGVAFADQTPGVTRSVFNGSTDADQALMMQGNPTTPATTLPLQGEYAEIYVMAPAPQQINAPWYSDSGNWSTYTTSRPGFEPYRVNTTVISASTSSAAEGYQWMAGGGNPADYVWARVTDSTNQEGKISFEFQGLKPTPENDPAIIYFHVTMQGDSSDPNNMGGNTTHNFWIGYKVHVLPYPVGKWQENLRYNASGGTIKGLDVYTDTQFVDPPAIFTTKVNFSIIPEEPVRPGYVFKWWYARGNHYVHSIPADYTGDKTWLNSYRMLAFNDNQSDTVDAVWSQLYGLRYDANGGSGAPDNVDGEFGVSDGNISNTGPVELNVGAAPTRENYEFVGYLYDGTTYQPGDKIKLDSNTPYKTLVAQWKSTIPEYGVNYAFTSSTTGNELPKAVLDLLPNDESTYKANDRVTPINPTSTRVEVEGGYWEFDGYTKTSYEMVAPGLTFTGSWTFHEVIPWTPLTPATPAKYGVTYQFKSATEGKDLPDAILRLVPTDTDTYAVDTKITPINPAQLRINMVDGYWLFNGYDHASYEMVAPGLTIAGSWTFHEVIPWTPLTPATPVKYGVIYQFRSATDGVGLPNEVLNLVPSDRTLYEIGATVSPVEPTSLRVNVTDGYWIFNRFDKDTYEMRAPGLTITGSWTYHSTRSEKTNHPGTESGSSLDSDSGSGNPGENLDNPNSVPATSDSTALMSVAALIALSTVGVGLAIWRRRQTN